MAWTAKPSATQRIERRAEPYLTDALKQKWSQEILPKYATKHGALMPILHEIQHAHRHIPYQAMIEVAQFLEIKPADVLDTVTFYEEFTTEKVGECVIGICQSIACEVCGHQKLLDHVRRRLDLEPHETTDDGKFTLVELECLGLCEGAPACLVDETMHLNATPESITKAIDEARSSQGGHH